MVREPLLARLKGLESRGWSAMPTFGKGEGRPVTSPYDRRVEVGTAITVPMVAQW